MKNNEVQIMKYISIGVVMAPSTEHILKVSHYGTEFTLTGDLARLWLDAVYSLKKLSSKTAR